MHLEQYLKERALLFNAESTFSCPDPCDRLGCKLPNLSISLSLVDLIAISLISGQKAIEIFKEDLKIGFDPLDQNEPWIGRICLELKKPCHFLDGKKCSVYPQRPIACALFPENYFVLEHSENVLKKEMFQNFPCLQKPCPISFQRRTILQKLWKMSTVERFLTDFYLFRHSPLIIDIKNMAGEGLKEISVSENGTFHLSYQRIEDLVSERLQEAGYLKDWERRIEQLDEVNGYEGLIQMMPIMDRLAEMSNHSHLSMIYQFDGNHLQPIRPYK